MKKRDFRNWKFEQISIEFGYTRHYKNFPPLEIWLNAEMPMTETETERLSELRDELNYNAEIWNEDELKFFFLSPLINLVDFRSKYYKPFTQRKLSAVIGDWEISGVADFFISEGIQIPRHPYFFLHEYKPEKRRDNDPLGQLLAEMLAAQTLNQENFPIYGCYIVGRYHFFVVLEGKEYAVSRSFDSTTDDIFRIFKLFRFVKSEIEQQTTPEREL